MQNNKIKILSQQGNVVKFRPATKQVAFGSILKDARARNKISQEEMADIMGVSRSTIVNWETNKNKPDYDLIPKLCSVLDISAEELLGMKGDISNFERNLLSNLRLLKPTTQRFFANMIQSALDKELKEHEEMLINNTRIVAEETSGVAVGTAFSGIRFAGGNETPFFLFTNDRTRKADAVVRVEGHSMEPDYNNGDMVCFKYTNVANVGDDVVAALGDRAFIKRVASDGTLYSVNPEYPFEYEGDGNDIRILGLVLDVVKEEDIPSEDDVDALNELFRDDIAAFYRERGVDEY